MLCVLPVWVNGLGEEGLCVALLLWLSWETLERIFWAVDLIVVVVQSGWDLKRKHKHTNHDLKTNEREYVAFKAIMHASFLHLRWLSHVHCPLLLQQIRRHYLCSLFVTPLNHKGTCLTHIWSIITMTPSSTVILDAILDLTHSPVAEGSLSCRMGSSETGSRRALQEGLIVLGTNSEIKKGRK